MILHIRFIALAQYKWIESQFKETKDSMWKGMEDRHRQKDQPVGLEADKQDGCNLTCKRIYFNCWSCCCCVKPSDLMMRESEGAERALQLCYSEISDAQQKVQNSVIVVGQCSRAETLHTSLMLMQLSKIKSLLMQRF